LVQDFHGARVEKDPWITSGKAPVASGAYGSVDHDIIGEPLDHPERCQIGAPTLTPKQAPTAPAAAINLVKSDLEMADELLIALPPAAIKADLAYRLPADCTHNLLIERVPITVKDYQPPPFGTQARGIHTLLKATVDTPFDTAACFIAFRTGHGRVLATVSYTAVTMDQACREAEALAKEAHAKAERFLP
jgi:hypothetical protein